MESVQYISVEFSGELFTGGRTSKVICINCSLSKEICEWNNENQNGQDCEQL